MEEKLAGEQGLTLGRSSDSGRKRVPLEGPPTCCEVSDAQQIKNPGRRLGS